MILVHKPEDRWGAGRMKILAPVRSIREAKMMIEAGANELYCGLHAGTWKQQQGTAWANRRGPGWANIENLKVLRKLCETAHQSGVKVYLTLNQPSYTAERYLSLLSLVDEVINNCHIDALIMADPGLISAVKEHHPQVRVHASSVAGILNTASVLFFKDLGVDRIIFPRYLSLDAMQRIITQSGPGLEYEAFILNDGCVFEEAYCHVSHAYGGAFCHMPDWEFSLTPVAPELNHIVQESFEKHIEDYKRWLWIGIKDYQKNPSERKQDLSPYNHPLGMCGLCALPELNAMGISSLKIVGREAPPSKKLASVRLLKQVLELVHAGEPAHTIRAKAKGIRRTIDLCLSEFMCYYR